MTGSCRFFRKKAGFRDFNSLLGETDDEKAESGISFEVRPRTSGLNRNLSVLRDFEEIKGNLKIKTEVIEDADSIDVINFKICPRTSCYNRKFSVSRDFEKKMAVN